MIWNNKEEIQRDIFINRYSCKTPVILVRF